LEESLNSAHQIDWTDQNVEIVAGFLRQGWSATQIGVQMNVSRNVIIGKVHRDKRLKCIGLQSPAGSKSRSAAKREAAPPSQKRQPRAMNETHQITRIMDRIKMRDAPLPRPVEPPAPALVLEPEPRNLALAALKAGECKFPVNDWPAGRGDLALFCGNPSERKSAAEFHPYCAFHQRRAALIEINPAYAAMARQRIEGEWKVQRREAAPDFGPLFAEAGA
jgi:hypothetical protein